jgi:hypothetical protein
MTSKATLYMHISNSTSVFLVQLPECLQNSSVRVEKHTNALQSTSPITCHFHTKYYLQATKHIPAAITKSNRKINYTQYITLILTHTSSAMAHG